MTTGSASEKSRLRRWAILATMLLGTMLAILDSSILNILVVPIMEEFQAGLSTVEWLLTSYNLAFAVFLIGFGSLGDTAGRRRLYVWGQVVFVLGSELTAVAGGPWQLLAPCASVTFAIAPVAGRLADKVGPRLLASAGLMFLTASVAIPAEWHPSSAASLVFWSNLIAGAGIGLATPALIRVATEAVGKEKSGLGAGIYKTANELGGVFGVVLLGRLLEARIVANALRQLPNHFLPQELSLKALTSLKALETHALQKGLPLQDLESFHRALIEAVQRGFDQSFGLAALVAGIGVMIGLWLPRRLGPPPHDGSLKT